MLSETLRSKTKNQLEQPAKIKQSTLSPYISQIQRRKKFKTISRAQRIRNDSSQKSFRIRQSSTSCLKRHLAHQRHVSQTKKQEKDHKNTLISHVRRIQGALQTKQVLEQDKNQEKQQILRSKGKSAIIFNEFYKKPSPKIKQKEKSRPFQRSIYKSKPTIEIISQPETGSIKKLSYTEQNNLTNFTSKQKKSILQKTCALQKKPPQFRKNKYQINDQVKQNQEKFQPNVTAKSQNKLDMIQKKQSSSSITSMNRQMDATIEIQTNAWYRKNKKIEKGIDKSTQKYLDQDLYRRMKSKNDIQVFLSLVKNPSKQRESHQSTVNTSNKRNSIIMSSNFGGPPKNRKLETKNYLQYEFDFNREEQILQMDNPSQQQSVNVKNRELSFEEQRKKVQIDFFHKGEVNIQWSEDDCQIQL